jgi:hypothetical protein
VGDRLAGRLLIMPGHIACAIHRRDACSDSPSRARLGRGRRGGSARGRRRAFAPHRRGSIVVGDRQCEQGACRLPARLGEQPGRGPLLGLVAGDGGQLDGGRGRRRLAPPEREVLAPQRLGGLGSDAPRRDRDRRPGQARRAQEGGFSRSRQSSQTGSDVPSSEASTGTRPACQVSPSGQSAQPSPGPTPCAPGS